MNRRLQDALQECLEALEEGRDPEQVLASYPEIEPELRSLFEVAQQAAGLVGDEPTQEAHHRSRTRILGRAHELSESSTQHGRRRWLPRVAVAAALALAILFSGTGLYLTSAQALPGDALYPVKRAAEGLRLNLISNPRQKLNLSLDYGERRLEEVQALLEAGRRSGVRFTGVLRGRGGARLDVQGVPVLVTDSTQVEAELEPGQVLQIEGVTEPRGFVLAERIDRGGYVLTGTLLRLSTDAALVDDTTVQIVDATEFESELSVGDQVRTTVRLERGYSIAVRIERLEPATTPTSPPSTPAPTADPPPPPTETEEPLEATELRFEGTIEQQQSDRWKIAGRWIAINGETEIEGEAGVGDRVEVHAFAAPNHTWVAERIRSLEDDHEEASTEEPEGEETEDPEEEDKEEDDEADGEEVRFEGEVESIQSGRWVVAGQTVTVDGDTDIEGDPEVGDTVDVRAIQLPDGTLYAERIERED